MGLYDFCVWVQRLMRARNLSRSICDRTGIIAEEDVFLKSILELPWVSITNKRGGRCAVAAENLKRRHERKQNRF
jgi:hypothetical protein